MRHVAYAVAVGAWRNLDEPGAPRDSHPKRPTRPADGPERSMLQGGYQSVLEARSREEFRSEVIRFAQKLDFQTVSAITVVDHTLADTEFITIDNCPAGYAEVMHAPEFGRRDPVMQH